MVDKNKAPDIEIFEREVEVINRVSILNKEGYKDEDMYIITDDDNDVSILRGLTDIVIKEEESSIWDRFKSFFKGEDSIAEAFDRLGLDRQERDHYKDELSRGKYLLFVDKGYGSFKSLDEYFQPITDEKRQKKREKMISAEEIPESIKKDVGMEQDTPDTHKNLPHDIPYTVEHDLKDRT